MSNFLKFDSSDDELFGMSKLVFGLLLSRKNKIFLYII